jgi:hypothetical protein
MNRRGVSTISLVAVQHEQPAASLDDEVARLHVLASARPRADAPYGSMPSWGHHEKRISMRFRHFRQSSSRCSFHKQPSFHGIKNPR